MYTISQAIRDIAATGISQSFGDYFEGSDAVWNYRDEGAIEEKGADICACCVVGAIVMAVCDEPYLDRLTFDSVSGFRQIEKQNPLFAEILMRDTPFDLEYWPLDFRIGNNHGIPNLLSCLFYMNDIAGMSFAKIAAEVAIAEYKGLIVYEYDHE